MHNSDAIINSELCIRQSLLFYTWVSGTIFRKSNISKTQAANPSIFAFEVALFVALDPCKRQEVCWRFRSPGGNVGACLERWFYGRNTLTLEFWCQCSTWNFVTICIHIYIYRMLNKRREGSAFHDQRPASNGEFKKGNSNHDDKYKRGQEKRRPSAYVEGKNSSSNCVSTSASGKVMIPKCSQYLIGKMCLAIFAWARSIQARLR